MIVPSRNRQLNGLFLIFPSERKISAIKWIRSFSDITTPKVKGIPVLPYYGLREAKEYVENCNFKGDFWIPVDDIPYEVTEVDEDDIFSDVVVKKKITRL